jgi:serine/threonine-protein kinase
LFAAAHLRLAIEKLAESVPLSGADLQPARNARTSLSEHDRVLLDAIEPYAMTPPDLKESQRRLEAALLKYPSDPELLLQLAYVFDNSSQPERAAAPADRAIAADQTYALAWVTKGDVAVERDDITGAVDAFGQCIRVSPGATTCLGQLSQIETSEGKCVELLDTSSKLAALLPDGPDAHRLQAMALLGSGQPIAAARAELQQRWDHLEPPRRQYARLFDEAALCILEGDFRGAEARYAELETMTASASDDVTKLQLVHPRMLLDLEVGRFAEVTRLAGQYLRQRSGWMQSQRRYDASLNVAAIELAAGGITRSDFNRLRDQWLARNPDALPVFRWVDAYAGPASTPEEGAAALATMPDTRPLLNAYVMEPAFAEPIGRAYVLGGKPEEAASFLSRASATCDLTSDLSVIFSTWAAFDLGRTLEALGDTAGACAAYQRVLGRWGTATPPSRTAAKSRARRGVLGCPP